MAWIKREEEIIVVEELSSGSDRIQESNAYEVTITGARLAESQQKDSKSLSLVIDVANENGETAREYFTILGKDGNTYFIDKRSNVKKQHIGLTIVNSLFQLVLDKEIFDIEPKEVEYKIYNKETEELEDVKGDGFPDLIGKSVGACIQIERIIEGADSKESPRIEHFFNVETGLFNKEEPKEGAKTKLDKWLDKKKEFKEIIKEVKERTNFGGKKETAEASSEESKKSKWGR